ncbi:MAG: PLDc N-terminal domain-containing protein [Haliea sp.]|nr:PLDc N-terminal domain-containing protein [Haliea sp.]
MTVESILALTELVLAVLVAGHALLYKRDTRSSTFWVLLILLVPWLGMIFYALFGINRIRVLATRYTTGKNGFRVVLSVPNVSEPLSLEWINAEYQSLDSIDLLENGDQCFPAMLAHIEQAQQEILLSSYIFDNDSIGQTFAAALQSAARRGVNVYVLIDGIGKLYSFPTIGRLLKHSESTTLHYATFLPTVAPWSLRFLNLRNHRKLLIIDRQHAYIGGMNIRRDHVLALHTKHPVKDVHFLLEGPVIKHLVATFSADWRFATKGEELKPVNPIGDTGIHRHKPIKCRVLSDGPHLNYSILGLTLLVAISQAQKQLRIVTPYFYGSYFDHGACHRCVARRGCRHITPTKKQPAVGEMGDGSAGLATVGVWDQNLRKSWRVRSFKNFYIRLAVCNCRIQQLGCSQSTA